MITPLRRYSPTCVCLCLCRACSRAPFRYYGELDAFQKFEDIRAILDHRPTIGLDDDRYPIPPADGLRDNSVEFDDVTFNYPGKGPTLKSVSFTIPAGSFVGICGHSGAGKTTMFKLIQRLYDPSSGVIRIGGTDIRGIQPLWLRQQMAVAMQEPILINGTMRANMVWGAEEQLEKLAHSCASGDGASTLYSPVAAPVHLLRVSLFVSCLTQRSSLTTRGDAILCRGAARGRGAAAACDSLRRAREAVPEKPRQVRPRSRHPSS